MFSECIFKIRRTLPGQNLLQGEHRKRPHEALRKVGHGVSALYHYKISKEDWARTLPRVQSENTHH